MNRTSPERSIPAAEIIYEVVNLPVSDEDRLKYGWGDHVKTCYWLVHYTNVRNQEGFLVGQTAMQKIAYFNFDSDALLFKHYLDELRGKFPND